jgi:lysophospholipase L1-like esterase
MRIERAVPRPAGWSCVARACLALGALLGLAVGCGGAGGCRGAGERESGRGEHVVLGDSNSTPRGDDWQAWPELLFDGDYVNKAGGGVSTYRVVKACARPCWWIDRTSEDDTWWIMLGTNDLLDDPDSTPERYEANMRAIIAKIPARDVRLVTSPRVWAAPSDPRNVHLEAQAHIDRRICETDPRVTCMGDLAEVLSLEAHYRDPVHLNQAGHRAVAGFLEDR